jgi:hypothetical protein
LGDEARPKVDADASTEEADSAQALNSGTIISRTDGPGSGIDVHRALVWQPPLDIALPGPMNPIIVASDMASCFGKTCDVFPTLLFPLAAWLLPPL